MSDLIDRGMVLDKLREAENHAFGSFYSGLIKAHNIIADTPSAQPERKKGKWIEYEQEFMLEGHTETVQKTVRECSVCTAKIAGMVGIMNFCPTCGADMREVTT